VLKPTIFREYDIRGVADVELLSADIEILGQAFGTYLRNGTAAGTSTSAAIPG
jgi:phosphomannomutase / phosphoglucomutase